MKNSTVPRVPCDDQRETLAFLASPAAYGAGVARVERIDTHASSIFLAGDFAYKLKRAVAFSYLDFSTVRRREASVRAELALNGAIAPDIYLSVRAIARLRDGSIAFDGAGEIIDWVVVMARFDQELLFDRLCVRGALDDATVRNLGAEIARFHASAESVPAFGGRASIALEISGNELNLALAAEEIFPRAARAELVERWRGELERYAPLLERRNAEGKVRRCHGDLHLRNVVLLRERPTLFDRIDFSDHLACIDVLYDLAFLCMDLEHRQCARAANLVTNAYLDVASEVDGFALLPLFISLRAAIRAHTSLAAAETDEARAYFRLAEESLLERPPRLIAIGGSSGTGKSTLARAIAHRIGRVPGARILHTDAIRKRLFGLASSHRLGRDAYGLAVSERVYRSQREETMALLRAGCSVVVDGVFARASDRRALAETAEACGVPFIGFWLRAPDDVLRARVAARTGDMSDATVAVLDTQLATGARALDWTEIDASGSPEATASLARAVLERERREAYSTDLRVGRVSSMKVARRHKD